MALKTLKRAIVISALAGNLALADKALAEGRFELQNNSPYSGVLDNYVSFIETSTYAEGTYMQNPGTSMEIWYEGTNNDQKGSVGVVITSARTYKCPLQYGSGVPNDATNYVKFTMVSGYPYPSNTLFTYLVDANGKLRPGDARKKITENNGISGREYLDNVPAHSDWDIYGTNNVNIAPIKTTITGVSLSQDGSNLVVSAQARPGTVMYPEFCTNLVEGWQNAVKLTNMAKYVAVTVDNFGGFDNVTWTNLPIAQDSQRFYRLSCDSYNSGNSNLVQSLESQPSAESLKTASSETQSLETKLKSDPAITGNKEPFYRSLYRPKKDALYKVR